jgi:hypothetical protein
MENLLFRYGPDEWGRVVCHRCRTPLRTTWFLVSRERSREVGGRSVEAAAQAWSGQVSSYSSDEAGGRSENQHGGPLRELAGWERENQGGAPVCPRLPPNHTGPPRSEEEAEKERRRPSGVPSGKAGRGEGGKLEPKAADPRERDEEGERERAEGERAERRGGSLKTCQGRPMPQPGLRGGAKEWRRRARSKPGRQQSGSAPQSEGPKLCAHT